MAGPFNIQQIVKEVKHPATLEKIKEAVRDLASREVLVGFPEDTTARDDLGVTGITNAALGYIHDNGAPEANIPARPFMLPGIESVEDKIAVHLGAIARKVIVQRSGAPIEPGLHRVGIVASTAIKNKINEGIPPPLANYTLEQRNKRTKAGSKSARFELERRRVGLDPSTEYAIPLIDTGAMRNAVSYVVRDRKERK